MRDLDGMEKNFNQVKKGYLLFIEEANLQVILTRDALKNKDMRKAIHHLSGFRQAAQEHMHKLWFYTFWPKWAVVAYLIWWL